MVPVGCWGPFETWSEAILGAIRRDRKRASVLRVMNGEVMVQRIRQEYRRIRLSSHAARSGIQYRLARFLYALHSPRFHRPRFLSSLQVNQELVGGDAK